MTDEKKKKLLIVAGVVLAAVVVGGVLMAIPATRAFLTQPVVLKPAQEKPLDVAFAKFKQAEGVRKSAEMLASAKEVAALDATVGKDLLKRTALFAAIQQKREVFAEASSLCPDGKTYEMFLSKDKNAPDTLLPELIEVTSDTQLAGLTAGQQPVWTKQITAFYKGMTEADAERIAGEVGKTRSELGEDGLLTAARLLSTYTPAENLPEQYSVRQLLKEAAALAELHGNQDAMIRLAAFAKEKNLLDGKTVAEYEMTAKSLGKTRGYSSSWDDDYDSSYNKTKSKGIGVALGAILLVIFILVILYYVLKVLFGIALILGAIALITVLCS